MKLGFDARSLPASASVRHKMKSGPLFGEIDTPGVRSHYGTLVRRPFGRASMKDRTVAILESRMRDQIASLVRKYGDTPFSAPALAEIPDVDPAQIRS
jgi:hypothetical protein